MSHDIFDTILHELDESLSFDENNLSHFSLQGEMGSPIFVCIRRNNSEMSLTLSVLTTRDLPKAPSRAFFMRFAQQALGPLKSQPGVGVYPGTNKLCVYQNLAISYCRNGQINEVIARLIARVQAWDSELAHG